MSNKKKPKYIPVITIPKEEIKEAPKKFNIKAKTQGQQYLIETIDDCDIIVCSGPPGSGKSHLSLAKGFEYLKTGKVEKLVLVRPLEECGKGIGFLPGELEEKMSPHVRVFKDLFSHFCNPKEIEEFVKLGMLQIDTIEYMRGLTFHKSFIIVDEAQNCTYNQLKMLLTRIGHNSKLIINGDLKQTDLPEKMWYSDNGLMRVPLDFVMDKLDLLEIDNIGIVELHQEDVVRHGLIKLICGVLP